MFCKYCGNQLNDGAKFCASCGAKVEENPTTKQETEQVNLTNELNITNETTQPNLTISTKKKYSGKSIAGFVLSLVGFIVAALPCGILGIIFSSTSFNEIRTKNLKGRGLAIAGLVISIIDIFGGIINLVLL